MTDVRVICIDDDEESLNQVVALCGDHPDIDYVTGFAVSGPEVISRGFVYEKENESLIIDAAAAAGAVIEEFSNRKGKDLNALKGRIRDVVSRLMYERTKRSPIVLPIILEV